MKNYDGSVTPKIYDRKLPFLPRNSAFILSLLRTRDGNVGFLSRFLGRLTEVESFLGILASPTQVPTLPAIFV